MTHYHITKPMNIGGIWVVDVKELIGNGVVRRVTVPVTYVSKVMKTIFHSIPEEYERLLEE